MRYHHKPGASWFRYRPEHLYCRNCEIEIRRTLLPLGHLTYALMIAGFVAAFLMLLRVHSQATLDRYMFLIVILWLPVCLALSLVIVLWGTRYRIAEKATSQASALSNNRSKGRDGR